MLPAAGDETTDARRGATAAVARRRRSEAPGFERFLAAIAAPALRAVALHWRMAAGTRRMPAWKDIDAVALAPQLPIVWAWRWDEAAGDFVGRLAGEDINAIFGRHLRGARLMAFFPPASAPCIFERYRRVTGGPAFMHQRGPVFTHAGRHGPGERIILPLAADGRRGDGLIGATIYRVYGGPAGAEEVAFFPLA